LPRRKDLIKIALAYLPLAIISRLLYAVSEEAGWTFMTISLAIYIIKLLSDFWSEAYQLRWRTETRSSFSDLDRLARLIGKLPRTSDAVYYRLRRALVERIAAHMDLSVGEVESLLERGSVEEIIYDERLSKLLRGELPLKSSEEVADIIARVRNWSPRPANPLQHA